MKTKQLTTYRATVAAMLLTGLLGGVVMIELAFSLECESIKGKDGPGGFVWKPESETDGKLVVLFPSKYFIFDKVVVERKLKKKRKKKCEKGVLTGKKCDIKKEKLFFKDRTNGDRPTYKGKKPGRKYNNNQIVKAYYKYKINCWKIGKSKERHD